MGSTSMGNERPEDARAEEYRVTGDMESDDTGTDYNPTTGEPEVTPHDRELIQTDVTDSDPNAASSAGLAGDMGISSERTGPADETGSGGLGDLEGIEGTRSVGTARHSTHGTGETTMPHRVHGPEMDDTQHEATQEFMDSQPAVNDEDAAAREENTAEVPSHELGHKNPGHSGHL